MTIPTTQSPDSELAVGQRIRVRQVGTIVEVFRAPRGSCLVRIDGDPDRQREWFLYRDEIVIDSA